MFERRLKIFLGILCSVTLLLVVRAMQLQVVQRDRWTTAAGATMRRTKYVDPVRGSLLDVKGRVVARDEACVDACVDFRALTDPPDPAWVNDQAVERLKSRDVYLKTPRAGRKALVEAEAAAVRKDITAMWAALGQLGGMTPAQVADARLAIVQRVEMRRLMVWWRNYQKATAKDAAGGEPFWQKWLAEDGNRDQGPEKLVVIGEQTEAHVLLHAIDAEAQNLLGKHIDRYPGLVLRPSTHRSYPYGSAAAHLMGRVSRVTREDLDKDPERGNDVREYLPNDEIGRGGVEALCERALRGTKGRIDRVLGEDGIAARTDAVPGKDVPLTIDIELQKAIENIFPDAELIDAEGHVERAVLHGAAVVIDVPTGEVRALASYPTYDLNAFDEKYADLYNDPINQPLLNRATMSQYQPGSTVKPVVGLSAITQGLATAAEGIECTGYLVLGGKRQPVGRCWVASMYHDKLHGAVAHHPVPWAAPHPTGLLTFGDALERSCNVYFETLADRLTMDGMAVWFDQFGLGRATGVGIAEARGRTPRDYAGPARDRAHKTWFSGIGQDPVAATPIQMANVAATIARDGVWMRPRLVSDAVARADGIVPPQPTTRPGEPPADAADRMDLHLSPAALAAARDGMFRVVNGAAGTGKQILLKAPKLANIPICGKTGTAQAAKFALKVIDPKTHQPARDDKGKIKWVTLEPGTKETPNPLAPWYHGNVSSDGKGVSLNHGWYIGFAPADHPQVAFAVMVEYAPIGGGYAAGAVAKKALEACVDNGYLGQ